MDIKKDELDNVFSLMASNHFNDAFKLAVEIIKQYDELPNLYIAGELAVEVVNYSEAVRIFTILINKSINENDDWFLSSAYLLRAYSLAQLGNHVEAMEDLNNPKLGEEFRKEGIFWLKYHNSINQEIIDELIKVRRCSSI